MIEYAIGSALVFFFLRARSSAAPTAAQPAVLALAAQPREKPVQSPTGFAFGLPTPMAPAASAPVTQTSPAPVVSAPTPSANPPVVAFISPPALAIAPQKVSDPPVAVALPAPIIISPPVAVAPTVTRDPIVIESHADFQFVAPAPASVPQSVAVVQTSPPPAPSTAVLQGTNQGAPLVAAINTGPTGPLGTVVGDTNPAPAVTYIIGGVSGAKATPINTGPTGPLGTMVSDPIQPAPVIDAPSPSPPVVVSVPVYVAPPPTTISVLPPAKVFQFNDAIPAGMVKVYVAGVWQIPATAPANVAYIMPAPPPPPVAVVAPTIEASVVTDLSPPRFSFGGRQMIDNIL